LKEGLSLSNVAEAPLPLPPLNEQKTIVQKLRARLSIFSRINGVAENQVELLKERRTALISAAVTGKIDVRNWQPAG
jgi:type I restriction enzyme S subunit